MALITGKWRLASLSDASARNRMLNWVALVTDRYPAFVNNKTTSIKRLRQSRVTDTHISLLMHQLIAICHTRSLISYLGSWNEKFKKKKIIKRWNILRKDRASNHLDTHKLHLARYIFQLIWFYIPVSECIISWNDVRLYARVTRWFTILFYISYSWQT